MMLDPRMWERHSGRELTAGQTLRAILSSIGLLAAITILAAGFLTGLAHIASKTPQAQAEARWHQDRRAVEELLHSESLIHYQTRLETRLEPLVRHRRESHPTPDGEITYHYLQLTYQLQPAGTGTLQADYVLKYLTTPRDEAEKPVKKETTLQDRYLDLNSISVKRSRPHRPARPDN